MARYDWPDDLERDTSGLAGRAEARARRDNRDGVPSGNGDLDAIGAVIDAGFEEDRRWMPLGPAIMRNGQATGQPIVSGRVRDLQVHPDGQRAYVGSANGGVWYTDTSGDNWTPLGSWALAQATSRSGLALTVGSLLVEWGENGDATDNPDRDVVYVGTGELKPYSEASPGGKHGGIGVLRLTPPLGTALATEGGNPWRQEAGNLLGQGIYRLAKAHGTPLSLDPDATNALVAATSSGLYLRNGPFREHQADTTDGDWTFIDFANGLFDQNDIEVCTDVLWNEHGLFVTVMGSLTGDGVYFSRNFLADDGTIGDFTRIELPNLDPGHQSGGRRSTGSRISLAHAPHDTRRIYVVSRRVPPVPGTDNANTGLAHGWLIDLAHTPPGVPATPVAAVEIADWPVGLYQRNVTRETDGFVIASRDQSHYDQAVVVTQDAGMDLVLVGGKSVSGHDAAIFRLRIRGTAAGGDLSARFDDAFQETAHDDPAFIGEGIHADVHALRIAGSQVWVGCDGGVFRRTVLGLATAVHRNAGLATAEPGFIASHPVHDGQLIAGTQDNGTIAREGGNVWRLVRKGDGGGCLYHPTQPHMMLRQYVEAKWDFRPARDPRGPALRHPNAELWDGETTESDRASFYSAPAAVAGETDDLARVFVGTDRIWMSTDWGVGPAGTTMTWVTIPTATDPHPLTDSSTLNLDVILEEFDIEQDRFKTALGSTDRIEKIVVLSPGQLPPIADGGPPLFSGTRLLVQCLTTIRVFAFEPQTAGAIPTWTSISDSVVSKSSGQERRSERKVDDDVPSPFTDNMPSPGRSAWTDIAAHTATTFYVATTGDVKRENDGTLTVNQNFDTLWWYDGDGRWYPTGLFSTEPDAAAGVAGTPASAHSVLVDPANPEIVYVGTRIGVFQGALDLSADHPSWTWRPVMENLPQALVEDLSIFQSGDRRYLRAALVSLGVWERDLSEVPHSVGRSYIRSVDYDTGRSTLPAQFWRRERDPATRTPLRIDRSPDILMRRTSPAWHPRLPTEAEFVETRSSGGSFPLDTYDAWVQVHHRDTTALDAADMAVHLFVLPFVTGDLPEDLIVDDALRGAIVNSVGGPGLASNAFPGLALRYAGRQTPAGPLSARQPRAVHFDVDLSFPLVSGPSDRVTLLAIIDPANRPFQEAELEPSSATGTLGEILRQSPYVAARTFARS